MTKVEQILKETGSLHSDEIILIVQELLKRIKKAENVKRIISEYKGAGKGVWKIDAQEYVNESRSDDRI